MSTQAQAPTPFREESSNSQDDDPLRLRMQERDVPNLSNQQREVRAMDHSIALEKPSSTNLHILMKNFIHLLTLAEEAVLEEEAFLDSLKKFQNHKLGMESHYMMIMNIQVATTKQPTSNFKPWPKKEEAPRGTFQSPTKQKMEERGKIISNPPKRFKCNYVGHYASSCPTKRALIFREDSNGLIEKEEDESGECVEGEENGEDDEHVDLNPLESNDDVLSLVT
ncbi:hypothetical protein M9H77_35950 [Catharanthus roseus]|uniref:Uncharacterized protein n=1 Tax=Catharanthus roseus TaxID=4058 RepID=A0ACB9ZU51_CATRO|nr:hypothetical protein M9H77_35950 [Catharanthus roseus]